MYYIVLKRRKQGEQLLVEHFDADGKPLTKQGAKNRAQELSERFNYYETQVIEARTITRWGPIDTNELRIHSSSSD